MAVSCWNACWAVDGRSILQKVAGYTENHELIGFHASYSMGRSHHARRIPRRIKRCINRIALIENEREVVTRSTTAKSPHDADSGGSKYNPDVC